VNHPVYYFNYSHSAQEGQLDCLIWLKRYTASVKIKVGIDQLNPALVAAQQGRLDCLRYLMRVERNLVTATDKNGYNVLHYGKA